MDKKTKKKERERERREQAKSRAEAWEKLTPEQQRDVLDARLGERVGAARQRQRLAVAIANASVARLRDALHLLGEHALKAGETFSRFNRVTGGFNEIAGLEEVNE